MFSATHSIFPVNRFLSFFSIGISHRRSVLCQSFDSSKSISDLLRMEEGFSFFSFPRLHLAQAGKGWDFYLKMKGAFVGLGIYRVGGHT